jgi:acyl-CoA thioester hydrolase
LQLTYISQPILVRYGETDQMGIVHHSNYLRYFEVARLEWLSQLGISYNQIEKEGIHMPVISVSIDYKHPARFEDSLKIKITLKEPPQVKMTFDYEVFNQANKLVCSASTTLAFLKVSSGRPIRCPENFKILFRFE